MAIGAMGAFSPDAITKMLLDATLDKSPFASAFLRRRDPMLEAERIGNAVAKLKSCSKAGRQWIADERCMYAGLHPHYFKFRRLDEHMIPKHTPLGYVHEVTIDWSTIRMEVVAK